MIQKCVMYYYLWVTIKLKTIFSKFCQYKLFVILNPKMYIYAVT